MIDSHTLAHETITRHHIGPQSVFDNRSMALLERFCRNPEDKHTLLKENDMVDEAGDVPGNRANEVLVDEEVERLREWFVAGKPRVT
ncbi:hypothetical protein LTS18_004460 [Coniosporium uncinatum]|uniref:Uncharacterized protein n=1 Tax=Coniosporium uncinatum TaxID=93489 RepID=A0ACC3D6A5_9PEZI|nr:hypothetical protein LTS18_004460 [Coniosporium uncinatum]